MPDRYGENDDRETPNAGYPQAVPTVEAREQAADYRIGDCDLCDRTGIRNGFSCDHIDHRPAAARGMAKIRAAMGWNR